MKKKKNSRHLLKNWPFSPLPGMKEDKMGMLWRDAFRTNTAKLHLNVNQRAFKSWQVKKVQYQLWTGWFFRARQRASVIKDKVSYFPCMSPRVQGTTVKEHHSEEWKSTHASSRRRSVAWLWEGGTQNLLERAAPLSFRDLPVSYLYSFPPSCSLSSCSTENFPSRAMRKPNLRSFIGLASFFSKFRFERRSMWWVGHRWDA